MNKYKDSDWNHRKNSDLLSELGHSTASYMTLKCVFFQYIYVLFMDWLGQQFVMTLQAQNIAISQPGKPLLMTAAICLPYHTLSVLV